MKSRFDRGRFARRGIAIGASKWFSSCRHAMAVAFLLCSLSGCGGPEEIEYPPEVIPDIPPGDRSSGDLTPPN